MSKNKSYESKAQISTIKATSRASVKIFTVYAHIAPNDKLYFGITSMIPEKRWGNNGYCYRHQVLFYRAIQKYGWDNFQHIIIAKGLTQEKAYKMERDLIFMFQSNNSSFGYNITAGGDGVNGYHHTDKAKQRLSKYAIKHKSHLNILKNPSDRRKKCALIDRRGNIVYSFSSLTECANFLDISIACVSRKVRKNGTFGYLKFVEI